MQVESFLTGKSFSIDRNINAQAMDTHGEKVAKTLMDAQKKKKEMTVRLRPISRKVTLAHMTRTYMADGSGKKKEKKDKKAVSTERNANVWSGLAQPRSL
jgi:N-acetyl-beta-hexosaminidase